MNHSRVVVLSWLGLLLVGVGSARARSPEPAGGAIDARFDALVDEYYAGYSAAHPTSATELGIHDHDGDLEDLSAASVAAHDGRLKTWERRFAELDGKVHDARRADDLAFLRSSLLAERLELERVQSWRHRADFYSGLASRSVYVLIKRDFAPADVRLRAVIAREEKIPALLALARRNLEGVARVNVDIALDELPGIIDFFTSDVPKAFGKVLGPCEKGAPDCARNQALRARFERSTKVATSALSDYGAFIRKQILPGASASFALGPELFREKLRVEEMVDLPLDVLEARGAAELKRLQAEYQTTAQKIDAKQPFLAVQHELAKDHPAPARAIVETQARLAGLRTFLLEHNIVTVPSEVMPSVEETPAFMRATTFASMETPGPFETHAKEAYYNVTLPEKSWSADQVEEMMQGFNRPLVDVVSIHEAFPGHYVQFLWLPKIDSKVRKFESSSSNAEGWAHYCEQMLLDEGYGSGNPKLRLAQLQDALLRAARYVVGIRLHTRGMTIAQAEDFFVREGYQSKKVAQMETRRGTEDPTYLYYTFGKLEILKLRDDYKQRLGSAYTLKKFHDAFLGQGAVPLPLVRRALLGRI